MTPTPQLLTAEELAHIQSAIDAGQFGVWINHAYWEISGQTINGIQVRRLLATISSLEAKITELRGAFVARGPSGQVRDKTEDWERKRSSQEDTAHHAELGTSPGGIGVGLPSLPPASPPDGVERSIAAIIKDFAVTAIAPMVIPTASAIVWVDFANCCASAILAAGYRKPAPSGEAMEVAERFFASHAVQMFKTLGGNWNRHAVNTMTALLTSDRAATEARVREECAKVAEQTLPDKSRINHTGDDYLDYVSVYKWSDGTEIAAAIRAGGKT